MCLTCGRHTNQNNPQIKEEIRKNLIILEHHEGIPIYYDSSSDKELETYLTIAEFPSAIRTPTVSKSVRTGWFVGWMDGRTLGRWIDLRP